MTTHLVSYPRCGNTWLRYCSEFLLESSTIGENGSRIHLGQNSNKPASLKKLHCITQKQSNEIKKLVILVRNYKECIPRQIGKNDIEALKFSTSNVSTFFKSSTGNLSKNYIHILNYFDKFKGDKLLIYYEDLMTDPGVELKRFSDFMKAKPERLKVFLQELDEHKKRSLDIYGTSKTKGENLTFNSDKMSNEKKKQWDHYMIDNFEELYNKYLIRYKDKGNE